MKKTVKCLILFVLMAAILVCSGCAQKYKQVSGAEEKQESALKAQPEINDPGDPIKYEVSGVFSSDMVLQRDKVINVWGWSRNKGGYIYGELMGEKRYAQIDEKGKWMLQFSPKDYTSEGQTLTIGPKNGEQTVFENVLIGDVWIVSGQSNAEYSFAEMTVYFTELNDRINENDNIRIYREDKNDVYQNGILTVNGVQDDVIKKEYCWTKTTPETVASFSAVGYMFVKELADQVDVPQGIVMATAGGCVINDFMDPETGAKHSSVGSFWPETQAIYKYFLAPFRHMTMRGILFYQGESDNLWANKYPEALAACVAGWRENFDSTFAFYNIQCTSHAALAENTRDWAGLPKLRAAQLDAYYKIPNSYLISTLDVGYRKRPEGEPEEDYAHTFDKWHIGKRAADIALAELYKKDGYDYGYVACPIPNRVKWSDDSVTVTFDNIGDGLKAYEGQDLIGFKVMLENEELVDTTATIESKDTIKISLTAEGIDREVVAVAYALEHSALLEEANLVNSNNVPCPTFCFYTDDYLDSLEKE